MTWKEMHDTADLLRSHFEQNQDDNKRWWCLSPQEHPSSPRLDVFSKLQLIDLFQRREPFLLDRDSVCSSRSDIAFSHTILLDSSAASWLAEYAIGRRLDASVRRSAERFLTFFADVNRREGEGTYDINLFGYLMESVLRQAKHDVLVDTLAELLVLQTFDYGAYLDYRQVVVDVKRCHHVFDKFGTSDFRRIAEMLASLINEDAASELRRSEDFMYMLLLKLAEIELAHGGGSRLERLGVFLQFLERCHCVAGLALTLGAAFFRGSFGKMFGIDKHDREETLSIIRGTAADLHLLGLPAGLLHHSTRSHTTLGYILTADRRLSEFARILTLEWVGSDDGSYESQYGIRQYCMDAMPWSRELAEYLRSERSALPARREDACERRKKRAEFLATALYPTIAQLEQTVRAGRR